jgi:phosphonatase-like hydrolase
MDKIRMVMFDLAGTTIHDDNAVRDCLYQAAREFDLDTTPEEISELLGVNKIHLYQFLIDRFRGKPLDFRQLEKGRKAATDPLAKQIFDRYEDLMIAHYRESVREVPGATDTFRWCHEHGIKVATDTGFHGRITAAIMDGMGWLRDGLVDCSVHVECIPGQRGRPAPFMIFYAMEQLNIQSVGSVIKVGDMAADMLEGRNAGCGGIVGVLSGSVPLTAWAKFRHTHVIPSVADLPALIESEFS